MNTKNIKTPGALALIKAERILGLIASQLNGISVSELMAVTGQSKNATHRSLQSLSQCGWLVNHQFHTRAVVWNLSNDFISLAYQWKRCALAGAAISGECFMDASKVSGSNDLVLKAVQLFHLVLGGGIKGKTLDELHIQAGCPRTTTYRLLCTWEQLGWLSSVAIDGRSEKWFPSTKLIDIAHQYENQQRERLFSLGKEYQALTGETL